MQYHGEKKMIILAGVLKSSNSVLKSNQFMTNFVMKVIQCKKASLSFSNKLLLFPTHHHHLKDKNEKDSDNKKVVESASNSTFFLLFLMEDFTISHPSRIKM